MSEDILVETKNNVAWLTINHPERHNAYDVATVVALTNAFRDVGSQRSIGAIVLTGAGDKAFCSGGYLDDLSNTDLDSVRKLFFFGLDLYNAIRQARQPVIAAVNGYAIGGGNELVIASDFAIASEHAILGQSGTRIGSAPVVGGTNLLALQIGEKRAKEVSFLSRRYTAQQALQMGWLNEVVAHERLAERAQEWADEILALSPRYLEIAKISSNYWWDLLQPGLRHGVALLWGAAGSAEQREGTSAFGEKRKPDFMQFRK
jgi:2-ketocyclohexanecarboxyl-CoA hydrolase